MGFPQLPIRPLARQPVPFRFFAQCAFRVTRTRVPGPPKRRRNPWGNDAGTAVNGDGSLAKRIFLADRGTSELSLPDAFHPRMPHDSAQGTAGHGAVTTADWFQVIDECSSLGVQMVQFIGGEPTLHADLPRLVERALAFGLEVAVFSNLVHVPDGQSPESVET